jgi:beta-glucosidase
MDDLFATAGPGAIPALAPWLDTTLSSKARARLLAAAMTPAELAGQLSSHDAQRPVEWFAERHVGSIYNRKGAPLAELARELRTRHRLKVPVLFGLDCIHGHALAEELGATIFPAPLAMAASFDPEQARRMGRITASEMVATGIRWTFGPNVDVARDLRFGRIEETFGEDPLLVGEIGAAMVEGLQATRGQPRVIATGKHFTGYSEGLGGRDAAECTLSWRVLRRDHIPPFRKLIKAGLRSVMSGYMALDGTPCVLHHRLLCDELRGELGFDGFVVSDANNVRWCTLLMGLDATHEETIARAVEAGNDVQLGADGVVEALVAAVESGRLRRAVLQEAAERMLEAKFALGLFEEPDPVPRVQVRTAASLDAAVDAAAASMVLLENRGALPFGADLRRIAVVGRLADDLRQQFGCWTLLCRNDAADQELARQPDAPSWSYLAALRRRAAAAGAQLDCVPGCGPAPADIAAHTDADIAAAVEAARQADTVIAFVGDSDHWAGEGRDRAGLDLPGHQQQLLEALHATGKPLVVVLAVTKPHTVPWVQAHAAAVVCVWNSGMGGGAALASLLWGDRDFSGRTPITWPAHVGQTPITYDRMPGVHFEEFWHGPGATRPAPTSPKNPSRDLHVWRLENTRHIDLKPEWVFGLWSFGHGLSYATIAMKGAAMQRHGWQAGQSPTLSVELQNTGVRDGVAVVQVYVRDVAASVTRPDRRLAAWARVVVAAGQTVTAPMTIPLEALELVDADGHRIIEPGEFQALVGFSSRVTDLLVLPFAVCRFAAVSDLRG